MRIDQLADAVSRSSRGEAPVGGPTAERDLTAGQEIWRWLLGWLVIGMFGKINQVVLVGPMAGSESAVGPRIVFTLMLLAYCLAVSAVSWWWMKARHFSLPWRLWTAITIMPAIFIGHQVLSFRVGARILDGAPMLLTTSEDETEQVQPDMVTKASQ